MMPASYPTQYYSLHSNPNFNFQMNRFVTWAGPSTIPDFQKAAPRIHSFDDWKREMLTLAEEAMQQQRILQAAFYYRAAEFFMLENDPQKDWAYDQFIRLIRPCFSIKDEDYFQIPYETGCLPAIRLRNPDSRGVLVIHGGFDSFLEELFPILLAIRDAGYEIIAFEGPGQGAALKKYHLHMTHEWEKPVSAVLDYFHLEDVALIGMSLGGYLATRAAAFEPRVHRVVAFDVMYDFLGVMGRIRPQSLPFLRLGLKLHAAPLVNFFARRIAAQDLLAGWALPHGMYVMGAKTPYEYLCEMRTYTTREISAKVTQDYLLLAGNEDHFIPVEQFYQQIQGLKNVRSLTARLFTPAEQAQNHCQVGNISLAFREITAWLDRTPAARCSA
jgi:pimeloyl-ACP methyl ester carboxylesterase